VALTALLDGTVLAEKTGDNPRVLALHGWARTRADWLPALRGVSALAVDLPGFGASPPPPIGWGSGEYAELLAPLLSEGGWTVAGHSFGGRVAVQLAAGWPSLVSGVVLTGVPLLRRTTSGAPLGFRLARQAHRLGLLSDAAMENQRRRRGSADYRAATGVMRDTLVRLVNEDYRALLPGIEAPVEMVWGAHDTAAPLAMAREAEALLPKATLTVSETSAHLLDEALVALLRERLA
jgi:pimeloyl-ACP methyl ester carboxylesterase